MGNAFTGKTEPNALEVRALRVVLGGRVILDDATVAFAAGRAHAVLGRSGAGKSVLLKVCFGLLTKTSGSVGMEAPASSVFVHQDPALLDTLSVRENIAFALVRRLKRDETREVRARVDEAAAALGLTDLLASRPAALSPGAQRRVALARALCLSPSLLVCDEPTTGLDPSAAAEVDWALSQVATGSRTLIVVTHSPRTLERLRPRRVLVQDGRVLDLDPGTAQEAA
jgi:ABC-type multidrug transport system ATPase subunit